MVRAVRPIALTLLAIAIAAWPASASRAPLRPVAAHDLHVPRQVGPPPESIWIEGEDADRTTFNRHDWYSSTGVRKQLLSPGLASPARRGPDGQGEWLAHYSSTGERAEAEYRFQVQSGGTYTLWLRASVYRVRMWYRLDSGARTDIDLESDPRERLNLTLPALDLRFLAWIRAGALAMAPGRHSVTFGLEVHPAWGRPELHGGIDALCLTNFPWDPAGNLRPAMGGTSGTGTSPNPPHAGQPDEWFPLVPADDPFAPDSITDMSRLVDSPAGMHGPLQRAGAGFAFADGTPVKFWGMGAAPAATPELQRQQARLYRKNGVNLVRLHPVEATVGPWSAAGQSGSTGGRSLDAAGLDRLDRWFATLKAEGIYMDWSVFYPHIITPADGYPADLYAELADQDGGKSSSGMVNFMPQLQAAEWAYEQALLEHRNPYTGLRYVDDPALAILEVHNEDSIFWHFPLNDLEAGQKYPRHTARLKGMWQGWLAQHYASDSALLAAWGPPGAGSRAGDSLANADMPIYAAWEMAANGPSRNPREAHRMGDFIRFLAETQRAYFAERGRLARELGFKGVLVSTAWMAGGPAANAANAWTDDALDAIDRHGYFGGGVGNWRILEGEVQNGTHTTQAGSGLLATGFQQVEDKPFIMSEWDQVAPNQWKAESAPLMAFYGMGLNGWDALLHFNGSRPRMGSGWPDGNSFVTETPHYLAQFPALALAVRRGDLAEGTLAAARRVSEDDVFRGTDALTQDLPGGGYRAGQGGQPAATRNLTAPPEAFAIGRVTLKVAGAGAGLAASERADWDRYWDRNSGVVQSVTGQLEWRAKERVVLVKSAKTQGIIGFGGGRQLDLPGVTVDLATPFVSLLFTPLDDRPLIESAHILVTALAQDKQTGARYNQDGTQLLDFGGPPLLLEPVQAILTFKGAPITSARVVDQFGVPRDQEVEREGNVVHIDGRYATYYYEIRRIVDAPEPSPMAPRTATPTATPTAPPMPTPTSQSTATPSVPSTPTPPPATPAGLWAWLYLPWAERSR